jgi:hypothetical protein
MAKKKDMFLTLAKVLYFGLLLRGLSSKKLYAHRS